MSADRIPEQGRFIEGSGGNLLPPTERGGQRWETVYNWLEVGAHSLLYSTAIVGAVMILASTQIPEISQLAGKLAEKVVTPSTLQAFVDITIATAVGLGIFYGSRDRDSLFRS